MNFFDSTTPIQRDALFNEFKGHLFEFHICSEISLKFSVYDQFLKSLSNDQVKQLREYEDFLFKNAPGLLKNIPQMAKPLIDSISHELISTNNEIVQVYWTGKHGAKSLNQDWGETDIAIDVKSNHLIDRKFFSIKLSKINSFTNTKSAGAMSFFSKYFHHFKESGIVQEQLNALINSSFYTMKSQMLELAGFEDENAHFPQEFIKVYGELPGGLPKEFKEVLYEHYSRIMDNIEENLEKFLKQDNKLFYDSILPLLGFTAKNVVQYQVFHDEHFFKSIERLSCPINYLDIKIRKRNSNQHFLEILIESYVLQVRIKPMNKFTTEAYKINCSIKHRDNERENK